MHFKCTWCSDDGKKQGKGRIKRKGRRREIVENEVAFLRNRSFSLANESPRG